MEQQLNAIPNRLKTAAGIIGLAVAAAVAYGISQDQITVRLCLEYFTVGHIPIFGDQPPTILAILWGFVASWWMGLFLGVILALAATVGSKPIRPARSLVRPVLRLLAVMAVCACVAGTTGYQLTSSGVITLEHWQRAKEIPKSRHALFLADAFAHDTSYLVGFFGALIVAINTWRSRRKESKSPV